jgi:hypothetical protein
MRGQLRLGSKRHDVDTDGVSSSTVYHDSIRSVSMEYSLVAAAVQCVGYILIHDAALRRHLGVSSQAVGPCRITQTYWTSTNEWTFGRFICQQ